MKLPHSLRALGARNFRLFLAGQGTSHVGNWVQLIAVSWLIYRLTGSTVMLGVAAFALQVPFLFVAPFAGVLLDRWDLRRVLLTTNAVAFVQASVMLALVASGHVEPLHLIVGNLVLGLVNAFDAPARQSLLVRLVDERSDLPNAIALNSTTMNSGRFVGPMVGGSVIASFGHVAGFATNLALRLAVISALLSLRLAPIRPRTNNTHLLQQLGEGLRYVHGFLPARCALGLLAVTSLTIQSYSSLMPWFASQQFHGDSATLGILLSGSGLGAVCGMVHLTLRRSVAGLYRLIPWSAAMAGCALVTFTFTSTLWVGVALVFVIGLGMMLTAASTNTALQTLVPDELRARVASIYVVCFLGIAPFGALANGWLADIVGAPRTFALTGTIAMVAAAIYVRRLSEIERIVWPMFQERQREP
jgi:MFS family permease